MASVGDIFQVAVEFDLPDGDLMYNVFDFIVGSGSPTDAEILTALATLVTNAYTNLAAVVSDQVTVNDSKVNQLVWSVTEWIVQRYVGTILPTMTFGNTGDTLPNQVSALTTFLTTVPRVVGKKYLPPFGEDRQDEGFWDGSTLTGMLAFANAIRSGIAAGSGTLAYIIRRKTGTYVVPYAHTAEGTASTQRKRKPGVGV